MGLPYQEPDTITPLIIVFAQWCLLVVGRSKVGSRAMLTLPIDVWGTHCRPPAAQPPESVHARGGQVVSDLRKNHDSERRSSNPCQRWPANNWGGSWRESPPCLLCCRSAMAAGEAPIREGEDLLALPRVSSRLFAWTALRRPRGRWTAHPQTYAGALPFSCVLTKKNGRDPKSSPREGETANN